MKVMKSKEAKILLAEDDKYICRAYKDGLERAGFQVLVAFDGVEAMQKVRSEKPDLILLDLIMPIKNGFEMLEELKKDPAFKRIPVIILSNLGQDSDREKGKSLGAVDYLVKSDFSMKEVIRKVREHLTKRKEE